MKKAVTQINWLYIVPIYVIAFLFPGTSKAQVVLTQDMQSYAQNFNTLPVSGSAVWESGTYYLPGWTVQRTSPTNTIITSIGNSNTGALYSFGVSGSADRALGAISSENTTVVQFAWGFLIQNKTGDTIKSLNVSFTGEQWRSASKTAGRQATTFWHSQSNAISNFNLSSLSDKGWTSVPELDFYSPVYYNLGGALNGNLPANKRYLIATIRVNIPDGHYIMLRWKDLNDFDDDHGLAIDDFKLTWSSEDEVGSVPLPVELILFNAESDSKVTRINWATASEKNSSHFDVERSSNGLNFESIGSVSAKGYSSQKISYAFQDEKPLTGTSYYRLKQVDLDGTFEYSRLVSVKRKDGPATLTLFPTVTTGDINLEFPLSLAETNIQLYTTAGRLVQSVTIPAQLTNFKVNVERLQTGNYFFVLLDAKGQRQVFRFIKK